MHMDFLSEYGMEFLIGAAMIVFAMSASRFIASVVRERKKNNGLNDLNRKR